MTAPTFTVDDARKLAADRHTAQVDKLGQPYVHHVNAVGDALADFDDDIRIAGYLHDVVEDTGTTAADLLEQGISPRAVGIIERVSRNLHRSGDYQDGIRHVAQDHDAALVKIADNAHNSDPERVGKLAGLLSPDKHLEPSTRYSDARKILYRAVPAAEIRLILNRVNPSLLPELDRIAAESAETAH